MLARLLDVVLPAGGYVVQMVEAYFDESGSHDGSPVLCVAGYIFEKDSCVKMDSEWSAVLKEFDLPFFRMSRCAHKIKPFNKLTKDQCIEVEKKMIGIIKDRASYGIAVTIEPKVYDVEGPKRSEIRLKSAYTLCAWEAIAGVSWWADKINYTGEIAYFFESGHRNASDTNDIMNRLFKKPDLRKDYRYSSHTFADKKKVRPLQAADLLAWQWFTHIKRVKTGDQVMRSDCFALIGDQNPPHGLLHINSNMLRDLEGPVLKELYPLTYPWKQ
ncbi:MAG: DUF3800 domain-containing protein [Syntrophorhabdales bacterium]|jgi:hypothetical protein